MRSFECIQRLCADACRPQSREPAIRSEAETGGESPSAVKEGGICKPQSRRKCGTRHDTQAGIAKKDLQMTCLPYRKTIIAYKETGE